MKVDAEFIKNLALGFYKDEASERRKLEIKSKWYDLSGDKKRDIEEFVKRLTAIANTYGPEGYLIFGVSEGTGDIIKSPLQQSKLSDETEIQNLLAKRVKPKPKFHIEFIAVDDDPEKTVSVIVIPPSLEKPHVMPSYTKYDKNDKQKTTYTQYIPVREGTSIKQADHVDLELMYYDRKNIEPEYWIEFVDYPSRLNFEEVLTGHNRRKINVRTRVLIQNTGRRPLAVMSSNLVIEQPKDKVLSDTHIPCSKFENWEGFRWADASSSTLGGLIFPIILEVNKLYNLRISFIPKEFKHEIGNELFYFMWEYLTKRENYRYRVELVSADKKHTFTSPTWEITLE